MAPAAQLTRTLDVACNMAGLILFGAGASFGSDTSAVPPLGARLFEELRRFNPDGWGQVDGHLASSFRRDFEDALKDVNPVALGPLQRAMAAYFFSFQPRPSSLYMTVAGRIAARRWAGSACTINYERLLELSLLNRGIQPVVGQPTEPGTTLELCLPHGCCHIFCDSARGAAGAVTFNAFAVRTDGPVNMITDPGQHRQRILTDAFPPVMSYFEPQKRTTAGHSFIEGQRARWKALVAAADRIAIIGVKVRRHDDHIWVPLAATQGTIIYCAGPTALLEFTKWAADARRGSRDLPLKGRFGDELDRICSEVEL